VADWPTQFPRSGTLPKRPPFFTTTIGKIALLFLLIAVIGGGIGGFFIVRGITSNNTTATAPDNVPLPTNSALVKQVDQTWYYTIASTTPQQVQDFYQAQLPKKGWSAPNILGNAAGTALFACQGSKEVKIVSDAASPLGGVAPPSGGVVLKIILQSAVPADCSA
jgi:hypothetical protein